MAVNLSIHANNLELSNAQNYDLSIIHYCHDDGALTANQGLTIRRGIRQSLTY